MRIAYGYEENTVFSSEIYQDVYQNIHIVCRIFHVAYLLVCTLPHKGVAIPTKRRTRTDTGKKTPRKRKEDSLDSLPHVSRQQTNEERQDRGVSGKIRGVA